MREGEQILMEGNIGLAKIGALAAIFSHGHQAPL